mmetsp:Transcript_6274/g.18400  ORF Transcript_6274/g.18400 Transcript_6274/m.18400 type:complete len:98 (+) Transcript_6274:959-1252(+)
MVKGGNGTKYNASKSSAKRTMLGAELGFPKPSSNPEDSPNNNTPGSTVGKPLGAEEGLALGDILEDALGAKLKRKGNLLVSIEGMALGSLVGASLRK